MTLKPSQLKRVVGTPGAILLGLGSIVGTGVFVSIGIGAGMAGPSVLLALLAAALLASFNGLSSAQLAASHPVSGGTYEYGYHYLSPSAGFLAGWLFLFAKSASAATAALGLSSYLMSQLGFSPTPTLTTGFALASVAIVTATILAGMRRTNTINAVVVGFTLFSLGLFVVVGLPLIFVQSNAFDPFLNPKTGVSGLVEATALMFVAYTGYGRIATLGEEVRDPKTTIPKAVVSTLCIAGLLYTLVAAVSIAAVGAESFGKTISNLGAPLEFVALSQNHAWVAKAVAWGAITAMLGVLLNLVLGLSRVCLAMGRRQDLPTSFAKISETGNPTVSILACALLVALLTLVGDLKKTWSFSAFTVLIYYALTNLAALKIPQAERLYPKWVSYLGLMGCGSLCFWIDKSVWLQGGLTLLVGFLLRTTVHRFTPRP